MKRLMMLVLVALLSVGVASVSLAQEGGAGGQAAGSEAQPAAKSHKKSGKKHGKKKSKKSKKDQGSSGEEMQK